MPTLYREGPRPNVCRRQTLPTVLAWDREETTPPSHGLAYPAPKRSCLGGVRPSWQEDATFCGGCVAVKQLAVEKRCPQCANAISYRPISYRRPERPWIGSESIRSAGCTGLRPQRGGGRHPCCVSNAAASRDTKSLRRRLSNRTGHTRTARRNGLQRGYPARTPPGRRARRRTDPDRSRPG